MSKWKESNEKYKNYQLPLLNEAFRHPSQYRGDHLPIEYRVLEYKEGVGIVETLHSGWMNEKTLHWIRKMYNKESIT